MVTMNQRLRGESETSKMFADRRHANDAPCVPLRENERRKNSFNENRDWYLKVRIIGDAHVGTAE